METSYMKPRDSKPEDYWYTDIEEYFYNSDKIMMNNKVVFDIKYLSHLPRAIEYANHRHDKAYQANLIAQEENANKRAEGVKRYTDEITGESFERYNINGRIVSKDEYVREKMNPAIEEHIKQSSSPLASSSAHFEISGETIKQIAKVKYNLDGTPPIIKGEDGRDKIKAKPSKPKTPLKNRMKQLGRR